MKKPSRLSGVNELIKNLYVYIVLIITLVISIFGGINLFNAVADYVVPTPYMETFDDYISYGKGHTLLNSGTSMESVQASYDEKVKNSITEEKNRGLKSIIKSIGSIIIALPIFFVFQKKVNFRKEKNLVLEESGTESEEKNK